MLNNKLQVLFPLFICILLLLVSCGGGDKSDHGFTIDPTNYGDYYILNNSNFVLTVIAYDLTKVKIKLQKNIIGINEKINFFNLVIVGGRHIYPSNAFSKFTLFAKVDGVSRKVYELNYSIMNFNEKGKANDLWVKEGVTVKGHEILVLYISDTDLTIN